MWQKQEENRSFSIWATICTKDENKENNVLLRSPRVSD